MLIKNDLKKLANSAKAKILMRFFKTGKGEYGEGDKFLGITVPKIRKIVKNYWDTVNLAEVEKLLHSVYHEERLTALLILVKKFEQGSDGDKAKIYRLYLKNIKKYINNWDLVDLTAPRIAGEYLSDKPRDVLYKMAKSKNLWEKRVAILSTFCYIYKGEHADTIKISKILLKDEHDLIHKAVGWMLREVGKRCSMDILEKFLKQHSKQMPRTMLRYAIEKFPEERRLYWLNLDKK